MGILLILCFTGYRKTTSPERFCSVTWRGGTVSPPTSVTEESRTQSESFKFHNISDSGRNVLKLLLSGNILIFLPVCTDLWKVCLAVLTKLYKFKYFCNYWGILSKYINFYNLISAFLISVCGKKLLLFTFIYLRLAYSENS